MTAFMWAVNGYSKSTCGQVIPATRCSTLRGSLVSKRRSSPALHNSVMLSSPEISDGEETPAYHSGTSSVEGSRPSSSDRFVLTGEFSSFESDAFVSGSSDREWSPPTEQLADLRSIFERNGSCERKRKSSTVPIVIDDSSSSDSEAKASTVLSSRKYRQPLNHCLIVSIPLAQIKLTSPYRLNSATQDAPNEGKLASKLAVGNSLTNGDESVLSASSLRGLRTPLSLKLKRMSSSNNYTVISSSVDCTSSSNSKIPVAPSSMLVTTSNGSGSTSVVADLPIITSSESRPSPSSSTATSGVCFEPIATSTSATASLGMSGGHCAGKADTLKTVAEQDAACALMIAVKGHTHVTSSVNHSEGSSDFDTLQPRHKLSTRPTIIDTSTASSEPGVVPISECYPVTSPKSNDHDSTPTNDHENNVTAGNSSSHQQPSVESRSTTTHGFSFSRHFSFYPSNLKLVGKELIPVYSLSLKNTDTIPDNHPVYTWTIGQSVENPRKRRKRLNH